MAETDRVARLLALRWRKEDLQAQLKRLPADSPGRAALQAQLDEALAEEMKVLSRLSPQQRIQLGVS